MKSPRFAKLFLHLPVLNGAQRLQAVAARFPEAGLDDIAALIDGAGAVHRCCPDCQCQRLHRHGHANERQRFRCRDCGRTFNDLTGTSLARLRLRGKWRDYLNELIDGTSVRTAAFHVGVHRNTSFRWRHRFLDQIAKGH